MQKSIVNVLPRLLLALLLIAGAGSAARAEMLSEGKPNISVYMGEITAIDGVTITVRGRQFKATMDVSVVSVGGAVSNNLLPLKEGDNVEVTFYDDGSEAPDASKIEVQAEPFPLT